MKNNTVRLDSTKLDEANKKKAKDISEFRGNQVNSSKKLVNVSAVKTNK